MYFQYKFSSLFSRHYSPHSKLTPLVQLAYTAPASMMVLCLGSTNTMKVIILCACNFGFNAFTHRNQKNKKNVPLETHPDKLTT